MSQIPKRYGPPPTLGSRPASSSMFGRNNDLRFSLRLAEIVRVDYENMVCDLQFLQGTTPPAEEVPISAAYWSKRGFLGAMPAAGSIAVVGYTAVHQAEAVRPLILAFLPNGFKTALNFDPIGPAPRGAQEMTLDPNQAYATLEGIYGATRHKFRKIYPGTVYGTSDQGSEIILSEDIQLFDRGGSEIWLREEDGAGIFTVRDYYLTTGAGKQRAGRIRRDAFLLPSDFPQTITPEHPLYEDLLAANLISPEGTVIGDLGSSDHITFSSGRKGRFITENGRDPNDLYSKFYTEQRAELYEFAGHDLPLSDDGFGPSFLDAPSRKPFIEKVMGTIVGNDPLTASGQAQYGKVLRPSLFSDPNASRGEPRLETVQTEEERDLAGAFLYRMKRPDGLGELFISHDKEGHVYLSVPASTAKANNLGAGRSIEADIRGSTKIVMGANQQDNTSLDIKARGALKWSLGQATTTRRSLDMKASGALVFNITGSDDRGDSLRTKAQGNIAVTTESSYAIATGNDHIEEVVGQKRVSAESVALTIGSGDYTVNILSNQVVSATGSREVTLGETDKRTIYTGGEETQIITGSSTLSLTAPAARDISFTSVGSHDIEAGTTLTLTRRAGSNASYEFTAPTGSYKVKLGAGSIQMGVGGSSAHITPSKVAIQAPQIVMTGTTSLGSDAASYAVIGGSPGPSPHLDYITGLPLLGNPVVRTL